MLILQSVLLTFFSFATTQNYGLGPGLRRPHFSASEQDVAYAHCRHRAKLTEHEMRAYLMSHQGEVTKSAFLGLRFANAHGEHAHLLEQLLRYDDVEMRLFKWSQPTYEQSSGHESVLESAYQIFGRAQAIRLMYILHRYHLNLSHLRALAPGGGELSAFSVAELDSILEALDDLPGFLVAHRHGTVRDRYKPMVHLPRHIDNGQTLANASIHIMAPWDRSSEALKRYTIIHEIGHNTYSRVIKDKEWLVFSGWSKSKDGVWNASLPETLVSKYAAQNPMEDYAESFSAYRYNPLLLKSKSKKKYQFLKENVFLGIEYTNEKTCQTERSFAQINLTPAQLKQVFKGMENYPACGVEFGRILSGEDVVLRGCIERSIYYKFLTNKFAGSHPLKMDGLKSYALNSHRSGADIWDSMERHALEKMLRDFTGELVHNRWAFQSCDNDKVSSFSFSKYQFDQYDHHFISEAKVVELEKRLCHRYGLSSAKFSCQTLRGFHLSRIPLRLRANYLATYGSHQSRRVSRVIGRRDQSYPYRCSP